LNGAALGEIPGAAIFLIFGNGSQRQNCFARGNQCNADDHAVMQSVAFRRETSLGLSISGLVGAKLKCRYGCKLEMSV
jgi:hypothetical protein